MDANHNIEDEKWTRLAKSIYEPVVPPNSEDHAPDADQWADHGNEKEQLERMAKKVDLYFELEKYQTEIAWNKVQQQIQFKSQSPGAKVRRLIVHPLMRIAAAILVTAMLSVGGYELLFKGDMTRQMVELSAPNQATRTISLPDGTLVSLNSGTQLTYPRRFGKNTREVSIEGEAFFEVKPDKNKPFIIHAGNARIKVLGTSFNVNAYPADKLVEVIVKTGKVQVTGEDVETDPSSALILNPGEKGTLVVASKALLKTTNENPNFIAWKTHELVFKATTLKEVIGNLEKVYKVEIRLEDPTLNGLLLTAHFKDYSLDFILKVIETTFQIETRQVDGLYILKAKS